MYAGRAMKVLVVSVVAAPVTTDRTVLFRATVLRTRSDVITSPEPVSARAAGEVLSRTLAFILFLHIK